MDLGQGCSDAHRQAGSLVGEQRRGHRDGLLDDGTRIELPHLPVDAAGLHLGEVENLVDQARQALALLHDDREEAARSEEHTSELQSLMRISYAVFCLKQKTKQ